MKHGITSIAFPNISTGIYGYPKAEACAVAVATITTTLLTSPGIERVTFVCFDADNYALYEQALTDLAEPT